MSRNSRTESSYKNEALFDGLKVLEALTGSHFEPVSIKRVAERANLPYDFCRRALITLKLAGFATQNERGGWQVGPAILSFSERFNELCIAALHHTGGNADGSPSPASRKLLLPGRDDSGNGEDSYASQ